MYPPFYFLEKKEEGNTNWSVASHRITVVKYGIYSFYVNLYTPITAGNVAHAPSPHSIPNNFRKGLTSSFSGNHPRPTPNVFPASPVLSTNKSTLVVSKSTTSANAIAASG